MPTITLPHGHMDYVATWPARGEASAPPVVFVQGVLAGATLWSATADALASRGVPSFQLDLPLGAHRRPVGAAADQSPRGVARLVLSFIEALELDDVTLVGNDTGGAICQFVIDTDASRIGRLVLTNCDAFEVFPPAQLRRFVTLLRHPSALALAALALRSTAVRHGKLGFGPFANRYDAAMTRAWVEPLRDAAVRRDVIRLAKAVDPDDLVAVGGRLHRFPGPVRLVWGTADPFFTLELAHRLVAAFRDAELVEVPGARMLVPLDAPDVLAAEIVKMSVREGAGRRAGT